MLCSNGSEYEVHGAAAGPPSSPHPAFHATPDGAASLPDQYSPPNPFSGGSCPPSMLHSQPVPSLLHAADPASQMRSGGGGPLYSAPTVFLTHSSKPFTPEKEDELLAKGRQLLEEHRRESAGGTMYTAEEEQALQQRGMELLRASRDEAAANGGQHVPAPLLSAAACVAAATAPLRRRGGERAEDGGAEDVSHLDSSQPVRAAPLLVHSPPPQQGEANNKMVWKGETSGTFSATATEAHVQELTAEVQRLRQLVAAQQAELSAVKASAHAVSSSSSSEVFTKVQMETAQANLIQQFNQHMAQCEQANQEYWARMSAEHQQEVAALQQECEALREKVVTLQSTQKMERESEAKAVAALKAELSLARQECTTAQFAHEAAKEEIALLTERLQDQKEEIAHLQNALTAATAEAQAARADHAELQVVREHFLELERAYHHLQSMNTDLEAAKARLENVNAELQAANTELKTANAAPAPPAHDAPNPFADTDAEDPFGGSSHGAPADDGELQAARHRIAELEAASTELDAARRHIADLDDALAKAAADLETLQKDVEEKEHWIEALRAGEASLNSLPMEALSGGGGSWGIGTSSDLADGSPVDSAGSAHPFLDTLQCLRARVAELTRQLEEARHEQQKQHQHRKTPLFPQPLSPSSEMVPEMEALGRQYADVQHRLALAEEARTELEEEVRYLRENATVPPTNAKAYYNDPTTAVYAFAGATEVLPEQPPRDFPSLPVVGMNPFADIDDSDDEGDVEVAAVTMRGETDAQNSSSDNSRSHHNNRHNTDDLLQSHPPPSEDDDGNNTPETQVSFHMGHDSGAVHTANGLVRGSVYGEAEDEQCEPVPFSRDLFSSHRREEEHSKTLTMSAATRGDGSARPAPHERDGEMLDEEEETTEDADVSVSTRVAAARGRIPPAARPSKVEDSGVAMQELGRQYAEAQHRLLRSEETRQSLEIEVAELRHALEQLQRHVHEQTLTAATAAAQGDHHDHHYNNDHRSHLETTREDHSDNELVNDDSEDLEEEEETRTVSTSFASLLPTAARNQLPNLSAASAQEPHHQHQHDLPHNDEDAELSPVPIAAYSEHDGDERCVVVDGEEEDDIVVVADQKDDGTTTAAEDAVTVNSVLYRRIAELEEELQTMTLNHEEELHALAEAAADRIATLEQEYAGTATAPLKEDEHGEEKDQEREESDVFVDTDVSEVQQQQQRTKNPNASFSSDSTSVASETPDTISVVAAARVEWEKDLEEERQAHAQQLHACRHEIDTLKAEAVSFHKKEEAEQQQIDGLKAELADACEAQRALQAELAHTQEQWTQLTHTLEEMQTAHEAQLAAITVECNREVEEHDQLLQQRLEEQQESFEAAIQILDQQHQDQLRLLVATAEDAMPSVKEDEDDEREENNDNDDHERAGKADKAAYWKAQYDTVQERFDQLQRDYDDFVQDTAALQQRRQRAEEADQQEQEQSRALREATSQQLTILHQRLEEMTRLVEAAQGDAQARASELREATAQHAEVEKALKAELTSLRAQAHSARDEVARLNGLNEELSELLQQGATGVEAALRERDAQMNALESQVSDLKLQLAAAGDRLAERQTLLQEQHDVRDNLQQQMETLKAANRTLEAQLQEGKRTADEKYRVAAHEAERARRDAEQARTAAQQALAQQHATHQQDIATLQAQMDDLRTELEVAQTVAATVPLEVQKHQQDLETVRERLAKTLRHQQDLQQQLKSSRAEVERQRRLLCGVSAGCSEVNASVPTANDEENGGVPTGASDARVNVLLRNVEALEERLREALAERENIQQERDRITMQLKSAARVTEVKEQALRRQEVELRNVRGQLVTLHDDLGQRVQSNHALQLEMDHLQERVEDLTLANAELHDQHAADVARCTTQERAEALLFAKAMSIPRSLEDHMSGFCSGYHALLQMASNDRAYVYGRCDVIEKAAGEAMAEAEAQNHAYEIALADAQEEQQQLREIIEQLEEALHKAEDASATATAEAKTAKEALEAAQRHAREDVFKAQHDLQVAELQHADTLHSLSLLQDEVANTAALIKNQKTAYERREAELTQEVSQLQAELEARKTSARLFQQRSDESRNELQDIADRAEQGRDQAVREAQALRAQLEYALPRLAQLEDEQAQRTADLMDTAQQLSALHKKSSSTEEVSRKHIEELNLTLQELLHAHAVLQRTHTATEATADRLKTQLDDVSQELERSSTKAQQLEEEATLLRSRLQEVETHTNRIIADDQARLRDADRRLQGLEQRNTALQQECKLLQETQHSLRAEFENTADALRRKTESADAQEQQLAHQIRLLRERAETLEAERQELLASEHAITKERDACQRENVQLQHKIEHLQNHLNDANGYNNTLNQEMVGLKTEHAAEVDRLRETITDAQKELTKCRQLLTEAETHQVELESTQYSLTAEMNALREELKSTRAQSEKATQQLQKEKTERGEMATLLQAQIAQLYEELRSKQEQLRNVENTSAIQLNTIQTLRQSVAESEERLQHARRELLDVQEAANAAKEQHRRDRYDLQAKLNNAEDALAELTRQQEQYRERMATKVELYEVAEQALRGEVTDLRADVARLEEALTATAQGKAAAEDVRSRQAYSIKAVESEVHTLRAQIATDVAELTALKVQLQQRTTEVEHIRREAAAQLSAEKRRWESDHVAACDALEEALRKEQQATKDAREARERALATLDRKQKEVTAMEEECCAMWTQVRQLQRRVEVAEYHLTSLENIAKDSATDLGVSLAELMNAQRSDEGGFITQDSQLDTSGVASGGSAHAAGAAVQAVLDELVRRLNVYTFAASTLDTEDAQLAALEQALERHQDAVDVLVEVSASGDGNATANYASGITPLRGGGLGIVELGLNRTPAARDTSTLSGAVPSGAAVSSSDGLFRRPLTSAQQMCVQQISQASSTYVHRIEDHLRTAQQMLRAVVMAVGAYEVMTGSASAIDGNSTSRPSTAALSSRHKLQVAATIAELHRRTATLTRAVDRVTESILGSSPTTSTSPNNAGSAMHNRPSSPALPNGSMNLQLALQELRRMFAESERYALLPFNELLCSAGELNTSTMSSNASTGNAAAANMSELSHGGRGRQGDKPRVAPHTRHTSSHPESNAQRVPVAAAVTRISGGAQLAAPSPPHRRGSDVEQQHAPVDDSSIPSGLSPIPPDQETAWF